MSRKKILFLSSWYPVEKNPTHGIFVQRHAEAVSMLNDVYVLYLCGGDEKKHESFLEHSESFIEHIIYYKKIHSSSFNKYRHLKKIYENAFLSILTKWGKPDLIHLNVIFPVGIFALHLSRMHQIPMLITEHWTGYLPEDGSYQGLIKKYFTRQVVRHAKAICPVTKHLAENMKRHSLTGSYKIVPNVVDTEFFDYHGISEKNVIVFFHLSSLEERQKNPVSILEAFLKIHDKYNNTKLIFGGDGKNLKELEKIYPHHAIEYHYRPMGKVLLQLYQRCDAFVLNSRFENLPVVLLEAMSCGKAVISSEVGGISEYISESNGILFSTPDVVNLCDAMEKYILTKSNFNPELIREFAIKHFSKKSISESFDYIYNEIT